MGDSLRVLLVTLNYPPPPGGIQTVTKNLEYGLREAGHEVEVLHLPMAASERAVRDYVPSPSRLYGVESLRTRDFPYLNLVYRRTVKRIRTFEPDVIHAMHIRNWTALQAATRHGVPGVLSAHALELANEALASEAITDADVVHVPSAFTAELVSALVADVETRVIPPGIRVSEYRQSVSDTRPDDAAGPVVCLSRFVDRKNIKTVIRAWNRMPVESKGGRELVVVGDGRNRDEIETLAADATDVSVSGWIDEAAKRDLLARAAAFVLAPTQRGYDAEGFGIVFIEAQAAGTPIVGSETGGVPEAIGDAGITVADETDPDALAAALERVLSENGLRETLRSNAAARIVQFDIPTVTKQHVAMYRDLRDE